MRDAGLKERERVGDWGKPRKELFEISGQRIVFKTQKLDEMRKKKPAGMLNEFYFVMPGVSFSLDLQRPAGLF